jgi:hypothetical protein
VTADQSLREVGHARERGCSSSDSSDSDEEEEEEAETPETALAHAHHRPLVLLPNPVFRPRRCFRFRSPQLLDLGVPDFLLRALALFGVVELLGCESEAAFVG